MRLIIRLIRESFLFAWQALIVNRLRTALSLLGVTIGIFSIIFVLSVVDSLEADMKESFEMIGSDIVFVQKWPMGPEDGAEEYEWWKYMRRRPPQLRDMEKLEDRTPDFGAIAFQSAINGTAQFRSNYVEGAKLMGVSYDYVKTIAVDIESGRYFLQGECNSGKNFAVIGADIREQLFGMSNPIGREITVGGLKVVVIGVMRKEGVSLFGTGFDTAVLMPIRFATRIIPSETDGSTIIIKAKEGVTSRELRDEVMAIFREIRGIKPRAENDFSVIESSMISGIVDSIVGVFNVVGLIIGVFAILVGTFSIANIMFVSVKERTGIIGIQKALGAKNYFILFQFLFESVALCLIGGVFGLVFVRSIIAVLNVAMDFDFILPLSRIWMGVGISIVVGLTSGIIPALRAARLNPVDAMRAN